uniref:Uncharacterized protein n=1 Tax=Caulobacter phage BL57 TaxID=3348355 RepID=A0AB74UIN4_9VIRU
MRGVEVNESYVTDQRSFDGQLAGKYGVASGGPDLTREQIRQMKREDNRRFLALTLLGSIFLFSLTWVFSDLLNLGDKLNLPF